MAGIVNTIEGFVANFWQEMLGLHWLLEGLANAMLLFVIGRFLVYGYREHSYLYQLDDKNRAIDTWIKVLLPVARLLPFFKYRKKVKILLSRAGTRRDWDADHFIASQLLYGLAGLVVSWIILFVVLSMSLVWVIGVTLLTLILPYIKLNDMSQFRFRACNRDLPFFIDYLALAMGAGLDFNQALTVVVDDAPASPLRDEFSLVLRNIKLGMSRAEALAEMDRRLESPSLKLFTQTMIQGMELGSDVVTTLNVMSETLQQKRFQSAEESAGKISVRMMIPMMCFVMPSVMIILLGPMVLTYVVSQ